MIFFALAPAECFGWCAKFSVGLSVKCCTMNGWFCGGNDDNVDDGICAVD